MLSHVTVSQVRKILELVQCKGEEACEYFIYVIYKVRDAYVDLQPWLKEINYSPSSDATALSVVNTDPSKYHSHFVLMLSYDMSCKGVCSSKGLMSTTGALFLCCIASHIEVFLPLWLSGDPKESIPGAASVLVSLKLNPKLCLIVSY